MCTSFNGSRSDPRAVIYARATIDLASRDVRIEDVPCGNLEDVLGGFGRSFQILAERTITQAFTPDNPLIVNAGAAADELGHRLRHDPADHVTMSDPTSRDSWLSVSI